jgi:hypothetical protein
VSGRVFVRDSAARRLVAEVTKLKGRALPLVLPPGGYDVVVVEGPLAKRALARVTSVGATVTGASFAPVSLEDAVPRGLLPLTHFPINLGFISPLEINSYAPRVSNNVGVTVLFGRAARIYGAGLSLGGNFVDEELAGAVFGLGFNGAAGPVTGGMFGTANVALSDVTGAQGGVLFNLGTSRTTGAAWAVANVHRSLVGAQLGLVNVALDVSGLQLGLVNIAGTARGAQVGLVNIAEHSTAPIGLASLVGDGQASVGVYGSDLALVGLEARAGGRHLYSQLRGGATPLLGDGRWQPVLTAGLGASTGSLPAAIGALSLELDVSGGVMGAAPLGTALVRARLRPAPFVSLSAGPELRVAPRAPAGAVAAAVGGAAVLPGFVIGLSL